MVKILLIEDNTSLLDVYKLIVYDFFSTRGIEHKVYCLSEYGEYLTLCEGNKSFNSFDIVISDWMLLNRTTAKDILIDLMQNKKTKPSSITVISGYSNHPELKNFVNENKLNRLMEKPINTADILFILESWNHD